MSKTPGETPGSSWSAESGSGLAFVRPWRALVYAVVGFALTAYAISALPRVWGGLDWPAPIVDALAKTVLLVGAALLAGRMFGARGAAPALGLGGFVWLDVALGLAGGLVLRAAVELITPTTGSLLGPFDSSVSAATVISLIIAVAVSPFVEEVFFRGLVQRALRDALRPAAAPISHVVAIAVSTAAFVLLHVLVAGASTTSALVVTTAITGAGCGILTAYTGRLWAAIAAHTVFNLAGVVLLIV